MKNSLNHLLLKNGQGLERSATAEEVEVALAALEVKPGIYFGVDAGIDGLHPFQATLIAQTALQFDIYVNGIDVQAHSKLGHRLLSTSEVGNWVRDSTRGGARSVQESLKQFLALFEASENILLAGAFQFDSHKLHSVAEPTAHPTGEPLGVLFFAEKMYRRQGPAQNAWRFIDLSGEECEQPTAPTPVIAHPQHPQDDMPPGGYAQMVSVP